VVVVVLRECHRAKQLAVLAVLAMAEQAVLVLLDRVAAVAAVLLDQETLATLLSRVELQRE
tara:strand:+ start:309 stop:491 length:183 start_codon:yes stop_codon:yes gene_type:complete